MANGQHVLKILIDALWRGGPQTQQAATAMDNLGKGSQNAALNLAAVEQRSSLISQKMSELGREVAKGAKSFDDAERELKEFTDGLINIEDRTEEGGASVAALVGKLGALTVALGTATVAARKLFVLGTEGAQLGQLEESFDRLNDSVFQTPSLLEDMQRASRNTITDAQAMAAVLTLTAGASDEMAREMARAAPQLLEIAKAATTLNPTLGTTESVFASLATGIKRSSPLLIDNSGLAVKVGEANQAMAEALGKSVEALTAEEKQLALLNETMRAGGQLIEQVGGDVSSQVDDWTRLAVGIEEAGNAFKTGFAEGVLDADWDNTNEGVQRLAENMERLGSVTGNTLHALNEIGQWTPPAILARLIDLASDPFQAGGALSGPFQGPFAVSDEVASQLEAGARAADDFSEGLDNLRRGEGLAVAEGKVVVENLEEIVRQFEAGERGADDFSRRLAQLGQGTGVRRVSGELRDFNRITETAILLQNSFRDALDGSNSALGRMEGELGRTQAAMSGLRATEAIEELTGIAGAVSGVAGRVDDFFEGVQQASEAAEEAAKDALAAQEQYWSQIDSLVQGAVGQQFNVIGEIADAREEIQRLRDAVTADPDNVGLVDELDRALVRFDDLVEQARDTWGDLVIDIITQTGGFDQVAADFAVAAGIMTQAQADAQLQAVATAEAIQNIGLAIDAGAISPQEGANLFRGIEEGTLTIEDVLAQLDDLLGGAVLPSIDEAGNQLANLPGGLAFDITPLENATSEAHALIGVLQGVTSPLYTIELQYGAIDEAILATQTLSDALAELTAEPYTIDVLLNQESVSGMGGFFGDTPASSPPPNPFTEDIINAGPATAPSGPAATAPTIIDGRTVIIANSPQAMALAQADVGQRRRRRHETYMGGAG